MYASVPLLSASRQNLRLLTLIRIVVLAAQSGAVGVAYATQLLTLPWLALGITWRCPLCFAWERRCACAGPGRSPSSNMRCIWAATC